MNIGTCGPTAIEYLAERFPQLYIAPAEGARDANRLASTKGIVPEDANLDHFITSVDDELLEVDTPAGPIVTMYLYEREDFETFMRIIGYESQPVEIPHGVTAVTFRGIFDREAFLEARRSFFAQGGIDWLSEITRLGSKPGAFTTEIIAITEGPYNNVPAANTPFDEDEWLYDSRYIRLYHECAHEVCRRMMPDDILPVWDEITADLVGLLFATEEYDAVLAATLLGVSENGFVGGRLSDYLNEDQLAHIDDIAVEVFDTLVELEELVQGDCAEAFEWLLDLKRAPLLDY